MADQDGKRLTPVAFMSYARFNDDHDQGRLTELRQRLAGETSALLGEDFVIFQDRNEILWGQEWQRRIEDGIDQSTFLIPILTPHFFKSTHCCAELERFLERERTLGRSDLLLPVYYVDCAVFNDSRHRRHLPLMRTLAARQHADWREFRFEPLTGTAVSRALAALARQIRDALERDGEDRAGTAPGGLAAWPAERRSATGVAGEALAVPAKAGVSGEQATGARTGPAPRTEPRTRIVDAMYRGEFTTISAAIAAAKPGERILVRPGTYAEGLVIDKVLEIVGDGSPGDVVVEAHGKNVILFKANMGRVANLTLRQRGGGEWYAVNIGQGRLDLEDCDISSDSHCCVGIHNGAAPVLRRNRLHDNKQAGVGVIENGRGTLEDNDIFANAYSGVEVREGGAPVLRNNRINRNAQRGIYVHDGGGGTFEDNDLTGNARGAWDIAADCKSKVKRARNKE